jgi:hypothetical protein
MLAEKDGSGREAICDRYHDEGDLSLKQNIRSGSLINTLGSSVNPVH